LAQLFPLLLYLPGEHRHLLLGLHSLTPVLFDLLPKLHVGSQHQPQYRYQHDHRRHEGGFYQQRPSGK
jgi:hypothetical protein